ncbi:MAG: FHA domain-containing protein, partial [Deltaproteobacteria bacterium]|nr:FHA domain-containing protein [Deltaproteobacteria bacterium]
PVTVKATALVPSIAGKAKPTTPEVKSVTTTPPKIQARVAPVRAAPAPKKESIFISLILSAMVVFLVIVVAILAFYKARLKPAVKVEEVADQPVQPRREVPALPQAMLVDVKNVTSKKTMTLIKENITIGRGSNNDLSIQKDTVSGFHATIQYKDGTFFLEDQRSKNKTLLNGKEIEAYSPERLKSGDEITFTEYKFIFLIAYQTPSGETLVWREN